MEEINKKLTDKQKKFFKNLSMYIDKPINFYGSITRLDYIPNKSDIDIDIFTDNEISTIQLLSNYLNINKKEFKKTIYQIDDKIINGYKTKYQNEDNSLNFELSIYNNKNKSFISKEHNRTNGIPLYLSIILLITKIFYYNLGIISIDTYRQIKQYIMHGNNYVRFIHVDV